MRHGGITVPTYPCTVIEVAEISLQPLEVALQLEPVDEESRLALRKRSRFGAKVRAPSLASDLCHVFSSAVSFCASL